MNKLSKILFNVFIYLFGIIYVFGLIANENASAINSALNVKTQKVEVDPNAYEMIYYDTDFGEIADLQAAGMAIGEKIMEEGAVLLKNDGALPLSQNATVNLYSANSVNAVYSGTGSSGSTTEKVAQAVTLKQGLENAGFKINERLWNFYKSNTKFWQGTTFGGNQSQTQQFSTADAKWAEIDSSKNDKADAGIFVISRNGGENADLTDDYIRLSDTEKDVLKNMKLLKDASTLKKIVVIMNSANQVACDFVDDPQYGVDALLWTGTFASSGTNAIGRILSGEVNPSGRLSDTFWFDHSANPVYANFGDIAYDNASALTVAFNKGENKKYVVYQEGIYNGYRYTETRYEDLVTGAANVGEYDYKKTVAYPFGYGLSYTNFGYSDFSVEKKTDGGRTIYEVSVKVTNNGTVDGKETVQIFLQKPYTDYDRRYSVEKAAVELVGYAKTGLLAPNGSETVKVSVDERYFASYDAEHAKTYVIGSENESDKYYLTAARDAHSAVNNVLAKKGYDPSDNAAMDARGDASTVSDGYYISFDDKKYSVNETITAANADFAPDYDGQQANYGVSSITNRFDDVDFKRYEGFSAEDRAQRYVTRSDWSGTVHKRVELTATSRLNDDQKTFVPSEDDIPYPTYGAENGLSLINLRNYENGDLIEYDNPLWDQLLDQMTWEETVTLLSDGLRQTQVVESIAAPLTCQQNGATGPVQKYGYNATGNAFEGFAKLYEEYDDSDAVYPTIFPCNGTVASTFNVELVEELGKQLGEESLWCGYAGIYGLGVNIHRGASCGRAFEYYSEDGFLSGASCAAEVKGIQSKGVFVILKHAVLNDQETNRHNLCVWANEQSIREIYLLPTEIAVKDGDDAGMLGMMTGLNRIGAKWTSAQGFCKTVLRAEFGMKGYVISDFYKKYMSPAAGIIGGNDLPDGTVTQTTVTNDNVNCSLEQYSQKNGNYGQLAWDMRESAHRVLYTVARSSQMNLVSSGMKVVKVVPTWQTVLQVASIVSGILLGLSAAFYAFTEVYPIIKRRAEKK